MAGILFLVLAEAQAATWTVNPSGAGANFTTIQAAIDAASNGDTISLSAGTFAEALSVTKALTIEGVGEADSIISGTAESALSVGGGSALTLRDLTVTTQVAGRGVYLSSSARLAATRVTFTGLGNDGLMGGGIYSTSTGSITLTDATLVTNTSSYGGHLYLQGGEADISGTVFDDGYAAFEGGAIRIVGASVVIAGSTFQGNDAVSRGGAIHGIDGTVLSVSGSTFRDNFAYDGGGIFVIDSNSIGTTIEVADTDFVSNTTTASGAHVYLYDTHGTFRAEGCTFTSGISTYGNGTFTSNYNNDVTIESSTFSYNRSYYSGGAIYHYYYGDLIVRDSVFLENEAQTREGGAVYTNYTWDHVVRIERTTMASNTAFHFGGGFSSHTSESLTVLDSTFADNLVVGDSGMGGGIATQSSGSEDVQRNWITGNSASFGGGVVKDTTTPSDPKSSVDRWVNNVIADNWAVMGGGVLFQDVVAGSFANNTLVANGVSERGPGILLLQSAVDVRNNIVAYNEGGAALDAWDEASRHDSTIAYNDAWENDGGSMAGNLLPEDFAAEWNLEADPAFVGLSLDGDPTDDVLLLAVTSPLLDAGDPKILDADGSRSDIGAYGGPFFDVIDSDQDGHFDNVDCDDLDPSVFPGAEETWYDGVNQDCLPGSDYDMDGDGEDAVQWGGADCDDEDPSIADCGEDASDAPDDPADVEGDDGGGGTAPAELGCACATGSRGTALLAPLGLVLALTARRRR